jgi:3-hydroxyacyl-CoA dehydrogenase/enoyl-CoA hydratase/3-hydroxybutyryl-CoA epimerase
VGFYRYEKGEEKGIDDTVYADLASVVPPRREVPTQQIVNRLVLAMVNEAARVLEERIVTSAGAVDLAMIMGTGFPPFHGGLLKWADSLGPKAVHYDLEELREAHGDHFAPAPLIVELAETDGRFYRAFP